eukprot:scaffold1967_cov60-Phaeocystis_antarctica.AAC.2
MNATHAAPEELLVGLYWSVCRVWVELTLIFVPEPGFYKRYQIHWQTSSLHQAAPSFEQAPSPSAHMPSYALPTLRPSQLGVSVQKQSITSSNARCSVHA